jgi:hypothetical protein
MKITRVKGIEVGDSLPSWINSDTSPNVIGNYFHDKLGQFQGGYNTGKGSDFPLLELELKTKSQYKLSRNKIVKNNSDWTVGTITLSDLLNQSWSQTHLSKKMKVWLTVVYDKHYLNTVKSKNIVDFRHSSVQQKLEHAYNFAQQHMLSTVQQSLQTGIALEKLFNPGGYDRIGYGIVFERKGAEDIETFSMRITQSHLPKLEKLSNSVQHAFLEWS